MKRNLILLIMLCGIIPYSYAQQNVGIGTNDPKSKLDVKGGLTIGNGYSGVNAAPANGAIIEGSVGIGTNAPDAKAALDITSTTKGMYLPRLNSTDAGTLGASLNASNKGLIIFNTTSNRAEYWDGTQWKAVGEGAGGPPSGSAGGDLTGTYPNPVIANNAIGSGEVTDLSLTGNDIQNNTIDLTTKVNNVLPVANGGSGVNTITGIVQGNGSSPMSGLTASSALQYLRRNAGNTAYEFGQINYTDVAGTPSSLPPSGTANGDLNGTYPNPTVDGLQGRPVSSTGPGNGDVLKWDGTAWAPATDNGGVTGTGNTNYITRWVTNTTLGTGAIYDNGKVGIGTITPPTLFSISSADADFTTGFSLGRTATGNGKYVLTNSDNNIFRIAFAPNGGTTNADYTNRIMIDGNGNVGIGVLPVSILHVYKASDAIITVESGGGNYAYTRYATPASGSGYVIKNLGTGNSMLNKSLYLWNEQGPIEFAPGGTAGGTVSFLTNGNVGIGTSTPSEKLYVKGSIIVENGAASAGASRNPGVYVYNDKAFGVELVYNTRWTTALFARESDADIAFGRYASGATAQNTFVEQMTLDIATGNLGIGTIAPGWKLDVVGNARIGSNTAQNTTAALAVSAGQGSATRYREIDMHGTWTAGEEHAITWSHGTAVSDMIAQLTARYNGGASGSSSLLFGHIYYGTNTSFEAMELRSTSLTSADLILSNGNIGVNTATPGAGLHVYKPGEGSIFIESGGGNYAYTRFITPSSGSAYLLKNLATGNSMLDKSFYLWNEQGPIEFAPGGTAGGKMAILTNGNVGIGTQAPNQKLEISGGTARISALVSGANGAIVRSNTSGDLSFTNFSGSAGDVLTGAGTFVTMTSMVGDDWTLSGSNLYPNNTTWNVGVGTTSPGWKLDVVGTGRFGANTAQNTIAALAVSAGQGSVTRYRDIDIHGSWASGEEHAITFSHGSGTGDMVAQLTARYNNPSSSSFLFGRFHHANTNSTFDALELRSTSTTTADLLLLNGNMGVGISAPGARLHVNSATVAAASVGTEEIFKVSRPISGSVSYPQAAALAVGTYNATNSVSNNYGPGTRLDVKLKATSVDDFNTNVTVMTMQDNGFVGIGTTSPSSILHVYQATNAHMVVETNTGPHVYTQYVTPSSGSGYIIKNTGTGNSMLDKSLYLWNSQGPIEFAPGGISGGTVTFLSNGNVGIGTPAPAVKLHIASATVAAAAPGTEELFKLTRPVNSSISYPQAASLALGSYATNSAGNGYGPSTRLDFNLKSTAVDDFSTSTTVMTLQSNGNVGIGTTAPGWNLDVPGIGRFGANTNQKTFAALQVSAGENSATRFRDIDIRGSWAGGEEHAISFTHGSAATDLVAQITARHTSPSSSIFFGRLYHSTNSTFDAMELRSTSASAADLILHNGNITTNKVKFAADGSFMSKAPYVVEQANNQAGCPKAYTSGTTMYTLTINPTNAATINIAASEIFYHSGRTDVYLKVDGVTKTQVILHTQSNVEWEAANLTWMGDVTAGSHTITISASDSGNEGGLGAGSYKGGCDAGPWGKIQATIFEK